MLIFWFKNRAQYKNKSKANTPSQKIQEGNFLPASPPLFLEQLNSCTDLFLAVRLSNIDYNYKAIGEWMI